MPDRGYLPNTKDFGVNKGLSICRTCRRLADRSIGAYWKSNASATTAA